MDKIALEQKVYEKISTIYDPEIPVNIYDLGLIYEVSILSEQKVKVIMTLTAPGCPAAQEIPAEVEQKVKEIEGIEDVIVTITWDPPWNRSMMSEAAQLELGML